MTLYQNQLKALPKSFYNLTKLKKLNISWNKFEVIPEDLKKIKSLKWFSSLYNYNKVH